MHTLDRPALLFACCLSALAGCVDAIGFLHLGGYFVSFMSGNSTRLGVGLASGDMHVVWVLTAIICAFVTGAATGTILKNRTGRRHKSFAVMAFVAALIAASVLLEFSGVETAAIVLICTAMGASNSIIQGKDDGVIGVTYMTGALVKIGHRIGDMIGGGARLAFFPYLFVWAGLLAGGVTGALLFAFYGLKALSAPALWAGLLTLAQWRKAKVSAN